MREEKERLQHEEEERRDRAQVQQFQRKFHKKSNRPPKHNRLQVAEPIWNRCYYYATAAVMVACMAAIMAIYAIQWHAPPTPRTAHKGICTRHK